jgi:hypothetical protein
MRFAGKTAAEAFIAKHGGKPATHRDALDLAKKKWQNAETFYSNLTIVLFCFLNNYVVSIRKG